MELSITIIAIIIIVLFIFRSITKKTIATANKAMDQLNDVGIYIQYGI